MSNPLFKQFGNSQYGNMGNIVQQFNQFKQQFHGDPRQQIQQMLNSGKITQAQYDQAVQRAKALQHMLGIK